MKQSHAQGGTSFLVVTPSFLSEAPPLLLAPFWTTIAVTSPSPGSVLIVYNDIIAWTDSIQLLQPTLE